MWLRNKIENCAIGWNFTVSNMNSNNIIEKSNNIIEIVTFKVEEIKLGNKEKFFFHDKFWNHVDHKFEIMI